MGDVGVVVVAIYIGTDAIAVGVANTGAGGGGSGAVTVGVDPIIKRGIVSIVARHANVSRYIGAFKNKVSAGIFDTKLRRFGLSALEGLCCAPPYAFD